MMKKLFALLMAAVMLLSICSFAAAEETTAPKAAVGDQACGFTVKEVSRFDLLGADIVVYEHDKTGALVMLIANEDLNRVFDITFRTPVKDDTGVAHVFEHATLDGSAKYPYKSLFFNLSYQTYNTYMNAATFNFMTTYPVASLSEAQLLCLADYYTDSCFNPLLTEDESIFGEEAWRYEMTDADAPLTLNGTVYSEMQGSYDINSAALYHAMISTFPGANSNYISGGKPQDIPALTWEELKQYHEDYYHPSNSISFLYGKIENVNAFLSLLDGYFSAYEKKDAAVLNLGYQPITSAVKARYEYPVAASADTANGAVAYYSIICGELTEAEINALDLYTTLMGSSFSPLSTLMNERLPAAKADCFINNTEVEPCVTFYATGLNDGEEELFKATVDEAIQAVIDNGFDPEGTDAVIAATALNLLLISENTSVGVDMIEAIAYYWGALNDYSYYFRGYDYVDLYAAMAEDGTLTAVAQKYLVNNDRNALVITVPVAGAKEVQDAALAEELAAKKAQMTEEEINAIVAATNAADETEDTIDAIRALTAATVDSLPEEYRLYDIEDTTDENGVRNVFVRAAADGVGTTVTMLDAAGLSLDQIHYFKLYTDLLSDLPTTTHTREQLGALTTRYLYNGVIRVSAFELPDEPLHPYMRITFTARDEDLQPGYDLVRELLFDTQFTDAAAIRDRVTALKSSLKRVINNDAYKIVMQYADSRTSLASLYYSYSSFLDYYAFLCDLEQQLESDPEPVLAGLQAVQQYFNNAEGAVTGYIGSDESLPFHTAAAGSFLGSLDKRPITAQTYDLPVMDKDEAIILDTNIQFNIEYASWEQLGSEYDGGMYAVTSYVLDQYLYPILRDQNGVYTVFNSCNESGVYLLTYRDPHIAETYETYANIGAIIAANEAPDQETLNGYIMSVYSSLAMPDGELADGLSVLLNHISGKSQDRIVTTLQQLKSVTPESFAAVSGLYDQLYQNGTHITAGSVSAITENAALFTTVINPFSSVDAGDVSLSDVNEGDWYYEAVRFCYEEMLVAAASDTVFGAEEPATLGDLATAMYIVIGGDYDPEAAIETLASYNIIPAEDVNTTLTREQFALYMCNFLAAIGAPINPGAVDQYPDADQFTPGMENDFGCLLDYEILIPHDDGTLAPQSLLTKAELCWALYTSFAE